MNGSYKVLSHITNKQTPGDLIPITKNKQQKKQSQICKTKKKNQREKTVIIIFMNKAQKETEYHPTNILV